jgi:hypothetical protein
MSFNPHRLDADKVISQNFTPAQDSLSISSHKPSELVAQKPTAAIDNHPSIFSDIYRDDVNISVWTRDLSNDANACVKSLLESQRHYEKAFFTQSEEINTQLLKAAPELEHLTALRQDIAELTDMFCFLFDLKQAGVRLTLIEKAMCPRFHVDKVPNRLVCTYHGIATQWLPCDKADYSKLGPASKGVSDEQSGIYSSLTDICELTPGDVALLKGALWAGNENTGLVHRSPEVPDGQKRLLLTIDFSD